MRSYMKGFTKIVFEIFIFTLFLSIHVFAGADDSLQKPAAPQNFTTVTGKYYPYVHIFWEETEESSKRIQYKIFKNNILIATVQRPTYIDTDVEFLKTYDYTVQAVDDCLNLSDLSQVVTTVVNDTIPPSVPKGLSYSYLSDQSINLTWSESKDNVAVKGYVVYRDSIEIARVDTNSYTDTGLEFNTVHIYNVSAIDTSNNISKPGKPIWARIKNATETLQKDFSLYSIKENNSVVLNWNSIENATLYNVYRTCNNSYEKIAQVNINSYIDNKFAYNSKYSYKVGAQISQEEIISSPIEVSYVENTAFSGTLNQDTTFGSAGSPYIINKDLIIPEGITLTILPGTILKFNAGAGIIVKGKLIANGTSQYNIKFISILDNPVMNNYMNEYWNGIKIESTGEFTGDNIFVSYGGNSNRANISCDGALSLTNSFIKYSSRYTSGVYLSPSSVGTITKCDINSYSTYGIYIDNCKNANIENNIIEGICLRYLGEGTVNINNNTIAGGIDLINYKEGNLHISDNVINSSSAVKITLDGLNSSISSLGDRFINNQLNCTWGQIALKGSLKSDNTLTNFFSEYVISNNIVIMPNVSLTIQDGIKIKAMQNAGFEVQGKLIACGTSEKQIGFQSVFEKPNYYTDGSNDYWKGISVAQSGELIADNIILTYAGVPDYGCLSIQGKIDLKNSLITKSLYRSAGLYLNTSFDPTIKYNSFYGNDAYGIVNANTSKTIDAAMNYWGSIYGPAVYNSTTNKWDGDGEKVGAQGIVYYPWLGCELEEQIHFGLEDNNLNGNYSKNFTDYSFDVQGLKLEISRTYNSGDSKQNSSMGIGWSFGFESNIKEYSDSSKLMIVRLPNGAVQTFKTADDGSFVPNDSRSKLVKSSDEYILTTKDQYSYWFNKSGYMYKMMDRNQNIISFDVDELGRVHKITDAAGREIIISYNNQNLISQITDPIGREVKYEYTNDKLTKSIDVLGGITYYTYDSLDLLSGIYNNDSHLIEGITYIQNNTLIRIKSITDIYGNIFEYSYDDVNKKLTIIDSNGKTTVQCFDNNMYPISFTDSEGKTSYIEYNLDSYGINKFGDKKSITDRCGNKTSYLLDANGNILKEAYANGTYKEYEYDNKNNIVLEKDELSRKTYYVYDVQKINLIRKVKPLNGIDTYTTGADASKFAITIYDYYSDSELESFSCAIKGLVKSMTDPLGNTTAYNYDMYANIISITNPENSISTYEYNIIGWLLRETSGEGSTKEYIYGNDGQIIKTILQGGETTRIVYDIFGRKIKEILPNEYVSALDSNSDYLGSAGCIYTYYNFGKVKSITDQEGNITQFSYDIHGNISSETKPDGSISIYEYDSLNRLVKTYFKPGNDSDKVLLEDNIYTILKGGNTQKIYKQYLSESDIAITTEVYDYKGRAIEKQNPDGYKIITTYNGNSTVNRVKNVNGYTTYYLYDGLNRISDKWVPVEDNNGTVMYSYTGYTYDNCDNIIREKSGKDKVELYQKTTNNIFKYYQYNACGKIRKVYDDEGRVVEYTYNKEGNVIKEDTFTSAVVKNTVEYEYNYFGKVSKKYVHVRKGDIYLFDYSNNDDCILTTSYAYDKNGNLTLETKPNSSEIKCQYDVLNRLTYQSQDGIDQNGTTATIEIKTVYNYLNKPIKTTDANGNITNYEYNKQGLLEKVITPIGTSYYGYDLAGRKIIEISPNDYDSNKLVSAMNRTEYKYDLCNRLTCKSNIYFDNRTMSWNNIVTNAYKYDPSGNIIKELSALGYSSVTENNIETGYGTAYSYNLLNKVTKETDPVSQDNGLSYLYKYNYDALGRKLSQTNANGVMTEYSYDNSNKLLKTSMRKSAASSAADIGTNTYDYVGNLTSYTDANGNITNYEYSSTGKISKLIKPGDNTQESNQIIYQYDLMGNPVFTKDAFGTVNKYTYDKQGKVISYSELKSDGSEKIISYTKYDKGGNKIFEIDGNGNTKENSYDSINRLVSTRVVSMNTNGQTTNHITSYTYDKNNNTLTQTDYLGNTYVFTYDAQNRLIEKTNPQGFIIEKNEYNNNDRVIKSSSALNYATQYTYDKNNRLLATIDPEGHEISQTYDNAGNIKTKTDGNKNVTIFNYNEYKQLTSITNSKNETTSYTYDLNGNMLSQKDAAGNITTFTYNKCNRLIKKVYPNGVGDTSKTETYTYYCNGKQKTETDKNGSVTTFNYDSHGNIISKNVGPTSYTFIYDNNGNMLSMTDSTGVTTYTYDAVNRITTKIMPNIDKSSYIYDIITNMPKGYVSQKIIDPKGNTTINVFDNCCRLKYVTSAEGTTTYSYYDNGAKKSVIYPNGFSEEYEYYKDELIKTLKNKNNGGVVIDSYTYEYDSAHNQLSKDDSKGKTIFSYDKLNRLSSVTEPDGKVTSYTFDTAGNRLAQMISKDSSNEVTTYLYNDQNRLLSMNVKTDGVLIKDGIYSYDNNGNVTKEVINLYENGTKTNTKVTDYYYDKFNQLVKTVLSDGSIILYSYNAQGFRTQKSINGTITKYVYDKDKVVLELDASNNVTARNTVGSNIISRIINGQTLYYLYNAHGDVVDLIDSNGNVLGTYYYDPFGNIVMQSGNVDNPYTYAGYQYDKETGLYYLMSRMYSPQIARFMQEDSFMGDTEDPLSLNLYTYCHNEPLMYWDYNGHTYWDYKQTLKQGSSNCDVIVLQKRLEQLGYLVMPTNKSGTKVSYGYFGELTKKSVLKFQQDTKNSGSYYWFTDSCVNGTVNKGTWALLGLPEPQSDKYNYMANSWNTAITSIDEVNKRKENRVWLRGYADAGSGKDSKEKVNEAGKDNNNQSQTQKKTSGSSNSITAFKTNYDDIIKEEAEKIGVDPTILAATIIVESGGSGFVNGNLKIRFEAHEFDRITNKAFTDSFSYNRKKKWMDQKYFSEADNSWIEIHTGKQNNEYQALEFAKTKNLQKSYEAISMGMGQIMGYNFKKCGYSSAEEMYNDFSKGEGQQIKGMIKFITSSNSMLVALQNKDFCSFVTQYNGDGQVQAYTNKLMNAVEVYGNN